MSHKKGLLLANGFLKTRKFTEHYEWLHRAAVRLGMELDYRENADCPAEINGDFSWLLPYDFVLFWDKDIRLGKLLSVFCREHRIAVYNSVEAVAVCDDKFETYYRLSEWNREHSKALQIPLIPTIAAPMTYANVGYGAEGEAEPVFLDLVLRRLGLPVVIKECFGSFGMQVHLAETREEAAKLSCQLAGRPFLFQKYIRESSGRDIRLQVVGDRVVAGMYRYSENGDFRANVTNGGSMKAYVPSPEECRLAVTTAKALGLDFAGVDILLPGTVCEVNSNAHFKNIYSCTGINVADSIMEYILEDNVRKGRTGQ